MLAEINGMIAKDITYAFFLVVQSRCWSRGFGGTYGIIPVMTRAWTTINETRMEQDYHLLVTTEKDQK